MAANISAAAVRGADFIARVAAGRAGAGARDDFAAEEVALGDFGEVVFVFVAIPHRVRVDDEGRAEVAAVHASGAVDADFSGAVHSALLQPAAQEFDFVGGVVLRAAGAAVGAMVFAHEDMALIHHRAPESVLVSDFLQGESGW